MRVSTQKYSEPTKYPLIGHFDLYGRGHADVHLTIDDSSIHRDTAVLHFVHLNNSCSSRISCFASPAGYEGEDADEAGARPCQGQD